MTKAAQSCLIDASYSATATAEVLALLVTNALAAITLATVILAWDLAPCTLQPITTVLGLG